MGQLNIPCLWHRAITALQRYCRWSLSQAFICWQRSWVLTVWKAPKINDLWKLIFGTNKQKKQATSWKDLWLMGSQIWTDVFDHLTVLGKIRKMQKRSHLKFVSINGLQGDFEIWSCYLLLAITSHQLNQPLLCHFSTTGDESQMCSTLLCKESCKEKSQPSSTTSDTIASIFQTSRNKGTFMARVDR